MTKKILIITAFSLIHAATSFICRYFGIGDDLMLTMLTMLMTFVICINNKVSSRFMIISLIVVNLLGLVLGVSLARLFICLNWSERVAHPLATLICTGIIGSGLNIAAQRYSKKADSNADDVYEGNLGWFISAFAAAIILRLLALTIFSGQSDPRTLIIGITADYIFSCLSIMGMAVLLMKQINLANYRYDTLKKQVNTEKEDGYLEQIIIKCGNRIIPVKTEDIAYFFSENKMNHVVLTKGTTYIVEYTISELELKLDPESFFRVSRGCIVSKNCIVSITNIESGRMAIDTKPASESPITVSRARVDDFMKWLQ